MDKKYERNCPSCDKLLTYKSYHSWYNANRDDRICGSCSQKRRCSRQSEKKLRSERAKKQCQGAGNPFYGKRHSKETLAILQEKGCESQKLKSEHKSVLEYWREKYGDEKADLLHTRYREKLSKTFSGEGNPMYGKPSPKGSGNGWSGWYKGWFFRSLLELSYMVKVIEPSGQLWQSAEKEALRIEYKDWSGKSRNYYADFLIGDTLVECKPKKLHSTKTVQLKHEAAVEFCRQNGYNYLLTDCDRLMDDEICQLRLQGDLRFTDRYERKFKERTQ